MPLLKAVLIHESDEAIWSSVYTAVTETTPPPRPLPPAQTPWKQTTSSVVNSSEYRKYMDLILRAELEHMSVDVPGLYETFFGGVVRPESAQAVFKKCTEGDHPLYSEVSGWRTWPESAEEGDVLKWLAMLNCRLTDFAEQCQLVTKARRRPLALPNKPLLGSTAKRKLDVGFVDHPGADEECNWSHILVSGELKRNPKADTPSEAWLELATKVREVLANQDNRRFVLGFTLCGSYMRLWEFDRLGGIGSEQVNINQNGFRFMSIILGFLLMNEEQLGFDPTIITADGKRFIQIERNGQRECLIVDKLVKRARCIAGRATTCWKAHREGDDSRTPLVIKDSWQYPERQEEGEMIREATEKHVINVARYYHHETVSVGNQYDDVQSNVRKSLDLSKGKMRKLDISKGENSTTVTSTTTAGQKQSSNHTDASLPPSKRTRSTPPVRNRVHRRVIIRDYGKSIYKASSRAALLAAFEGCIKGYRSLYENAGILQRDVSINNLMMNEEADNPSWKSFLIDLDLAIKEQREGASGADGKTGTRAFMAIGVLLGEEHSYMHDYESFFWVLFWICVHHDGSTEERVIRRFEMWNYADMEMLAESKMGLVSDERYFLEVAQEHFTPYYQPLLPWVNKLRRVVFPDGKRWKKPNPSLFSAMKEILQAAQNDPKVLAE